MKRKPILWRVIVFMAFSVFCTPTAELAEEGTGLIPENTGTSGSERKNSPGKMVETTDHDLTEEPDQEMIQTPLLVSSCR